MAGCASDRHSSQRVSSFPMNDMSPSRGSKSSERSQDAAVSLKLWPFPNAISLFMSFVSSLQFSGLRKVLLAIYLVIIILFVVALVVIVVLAPIESTVMDIKSRIMN